MPFYKEGSSNEYESGKLIQEYDGSVAALPVFALHCIIYVTCAASAADSDNKALYPGG